MLTLGIDTSGNFCSVAVVRDHQPVSQLHEATPRQHVERLMPILEKVLHDAEVAYSDLDRIGVAIGPGSFTGIRIGLAAANGIALATKAKVVGVGTLEAIAVAFEARAPLAADAVRIAAIDARKGALYLQAFENGAHALKAPAAVPSADVAAWVSGVAGGQMIRLSGPAQELLLNCLDANDPNISSEPAEKLDGAIDPVVIASIAAASELSASAAKPVPLYIRPPDARLPD